MWVELISPELTPEQRKNLAPQIVETVANYLRMEKNKVGMEFRPYKPEYLYANGKFLHESKEPMYHLAVYTGPVTREVKKEIIRTLTNIVGKTLNLPEDRQRMLSICVTEIAHENMGVGGNLMADLMTAR